MCYIFLKLDLMCYALSFRFVNLRLLLIQIFRFCANRCNRHQNLYFNIVALTRRVATTAFANAIVAQDKACVSKRIQHVD